VTEGLPHNLDKVTDCCVVAHGDDVWPTCEAAYNDKVGLATIKETAAMNNKIATMFLCSPVRSA